MLSKLLTPSAAYLARLKSFSAATALGPGFACRSILLLNVGSHTTEFLGVESKTLRYFPTLSADSDIDAHCRHAERTTVICKSTKFIKLACILTSEKWSFRFPFPSLISWLSYLTRPLPLSLVFPNWLFLLVPRYNQKPYSFPGPSFKSLYFEAFSILAQPFLPVSQWLTRRWPLFMN